MRLHLSTGVDEEPSGGKAGGRIGTRLRSQQSQLDTESSDAAVRLLLVDHDPTQALHDTVVSTKVNQSREFQHDFDISSPTERDGQQGCGSLVIDGPCVPYLTQQFISTQVDDHRCIQRRCPRRRLGCTIAPGSEPLLSVPETIPKVRRHRS